MEPMVLRKVISGGQTGADQGGLLAAQFCGLETGGCLPKGCETELGPRPELLEQFGMHEHERRGFPSRTFDNAKNSDATIRFAKNWKSSGELCTLHAVSKYQKPCFDVDLSLVDLREPFDEALWRPLIEDAVKWLREHKVQVLNVAGQRESTCPGVCEFVRQFMFRVLMALRQGTKASEVGDGKVHGV